MEHISTIFHPFSENQNGVIDLHCILFVLSNCSR